MRVPVGGVLVSRIGGRGTVTKGWNIWRVLPTGPTCVLEDAVADTSDGMERIAIAKAIDKDLRDAFDESIRTLRRQATASDSLRSIEDGITLWLQELQQSNRRNRREQRAGTRRGPR